MVGDAGQNVGALARALGGGGYLFLLFQAKKREESRLDDVSWWRWDGRSDVEGKASREEETLVGF